MPQVGHDHSPFSLRTSSSCHVSLSPVRPGYPRFASYRHTGQSRRAPCWSSYTIPIYREHGCPEILDSSISPNAPSCLHLSRRDGWWPALKQAIFAAVCRRQQHSTDSCHYLDCLLFIEAIRNQTALCAVDQHTTGRFRASSFMFASSPRADRMSGYWPRTSSAAIMAL